MLSISIVLLIIAGVAGVFAVIAYRQVSDADGWPTTQGQVIRSMIDREERSAANSTRARIVWVLHVEYRYAVAAREYTGRRISSLATERNAGPAKDGPPPDLLAIRDRYSVGNEVQVRYDPQQPDFAYLEIARSPLRIASCIAASVGILGLCILFYAIGHR